MLFSREFDLVPLNCKGHQTEPEMNHERSQMENIYSLVVNTVNMVFVYCFESLYVSDATLLVFFCRFNTPCKSIFCLLQPTLIIVF